MHVVMVTIVASLFPSLIGSGVTEEYKYEIIHVFVQRQRGEGFLHVMYTKKVFSVCPES